MEKMLSVIDSLEIEPLSDDMLLEVAGATSSGPTCCSCSSCSSVRPGDVDVGVG